MNHLVAVEGILWLWFSFHLQTNINIELLKKIKMCLKSWYNIRRLIITLLYKNIDCHIYVIITLAVLVTTVVTPEFTFLGTRIYSVAPRSVTLTLILEKHLFTGSGVHVHGLSKFQMKMVLGKKLFYKNYRCNNCPVNDKLYFALIGFGMFCLCCCLLDVPCFCLLDTACLGSPLLIDHP